MKRIYIREYFAAEGCSSRRRGDDVAKHRIGMDYAVIEPLMSTCYIWAQGTSE